MSDLINKINSKIETLEIKFDEKIKVYRNINRNDKNYSETEDRFLYQELNVIEGKIEVLKEMLK